MPAAAGASGAAEDAGFTTGGSDTLPPPLSREREAELLERIGEEDARKELIEHNLRLVVYIARRFENTRVGIEDLISIGTIGLIKAVGTYRTDKNIKLATYASRCIENEILMYLRKNAGRKGEVSFDEPLNTDWDGNELLLSDVLGTEADVVMRPIEEDVERDLLAAAINVLSPREKQIITLRFGLGAEKSRPERGGGPAGHLAELHLPAGKAHHLPAEEGDPAAELTLDNRTGVYYTKIKYGKLRGREAVSGGQRPRERTAGVSSPKAAGEVVPEHRSRSISRKAVPAEAHCFRAGANAPQSAGFPESRWYHGHLFALSRKAQGVFSMSA